MKTADEIIADIKAIRELLDNPAPDVSWINAQFTMALYQIARYVQTRQADCLEDLYMAFNELHETAQYANQYIHSGLWDDISWMSDLMAKVEDLGILQTIMKNSVVEKLEKYRVST